jgi:arginyl-tRNA synthetase
MKLSKRLELLAYLVEKHKKGNILADIGTDHAYLPCYLIEKNIIDKAYACDVAKGPFAASLSTIRQYHFEENVEALLGDGLDPILDKKVDMVTIAGMGSFLIVEILEKNNKITNSEGAKVVDLEQDGINTPCIIQKSNGSSIYATRDLAAILYRARTYDFDKCIYVTSYEQDLHFKQIFAVAKYLDLDEKYVDGLIHVSFGMVKVASGKLSTRKGNIIKLEDLLNEAIKRAKSIIEEKNPNLDNIDEIARKVGVGAVIFNDLYNSRIKDELFDYDIMLNFQGETCPYIQYMFVRINSVLEKSNSKILLENVNINKINDDLSYRMAKIIYNFSDTIKEAASKNEPYIISRYLIDLAKAYSSFYNENKILSDDLEERDSRLYLVNMVGNILKKGTYLLGIEMPNKM